MSIASALGLESGKKVRYAIVGLGDIAQEAMMPGIAHTGNSEITALVTGDPDKARELGERYDVTRCYGYDQFDAMLASGEVDAIYLATPNWRHAEFIVPALAAGIHVLAEKPLEISADKCREIVAAQAASSAKLMVAYRLHFEPATLATIETIRNGDLGDLILFTATFAQMLDPKNHRAHNGVNAGPLLDMAPYPINAARYIFEDEPVEVVSAIATRHPEAGLGVLDDTYAVTLRFPKDRIAQFVVTYYANDIDTYAVVGTKGSIVMNPGFGFGMPLEQQITIGEDKSYKSHKATDQFGGEMRYFSDCILNDTDPEPDAEEGFADLRVIDGILRAIETGQPQKLEPFTRSRRIDPKGAGAGAVRGQRAAAGQRLQPQEGKGLTTLFSGLADRLPHKPWPPRRAGFRNDDGYLALEDYGALGDGRSIVLSGADGSIDWWCVPNMDSPPLFDRILASEVGGCFAITPVESFTVERAYRPDSNVLETIFTTASGRAKLVESLNSGSAGRLPWTELARRVEGLDGHVAFVVTVRFGRRADTVNPYFAPAGGHDVFHVDGVLGLVLTSDGVTRHRKARRGDQRDTGGDAGTARNAGDRCGGRTNHWWCPRSRRSMPDSTGRTRNGGPGPNRSRSTTTIPATCWCATRWH